MDPGSINRGGAQGVPVRRSKGCQLGGNQRQLSNPAFCPQASGSWDLACCWLPQLSGTHGRPEDFDKRTEGKGPPE